MKKEKNFDYYVGLDIGTNSVGYAATDENYNLLKYRQHPVWGVHLFDSAQLAQERRTHRAARRRLDRRQQRIQLLRELFAVEFGAVDRDFFKRIDQSSLKKDSKDCPFAVFADPSYTDANYYYQYPTIHHLISDLIESDKPHDVRLVYLACAWLLAHRGHFFSDVAKDKIDELTDFTAVYRDLEMFLDDHECNLSWKHSNVDINDIGNILKIAATGTDRHKKLLALLQVKKRKADEPVQWFDETEFLRLLCGLETKAAKLFPESEYAESKLSLDADDEKIAEMLADLSEDDASLLLSMKKIYDWSVLADIIGNGKNISEAKVKIYEKHKSDLKQLKTLVKKYLPHQDYLDIFRCKNGKENYAAYIGAAAKSTNQEEFYKFLKSKLKNMEISDVGDNAIFEQINQDIASLKFLPKQVISDNRTIPYQLYWNELKKVLNQASTYLSFLNQRDSDGLSTIDKILSIMEFRIPYFVGPLSAHSKFAWLKRKADGKIYPWNFEQKVDLDASEQAFIKRMTNKCTYLPGEDVLPKHSLLYQKFEVLNLINAIHNNGAPISVECKQKIFELFLKYNKVTKKTILNYLKTNNLYSNINENSITGIDDTVTAFLSSRKIFKLMLENKKLTETEVEEIINQKSFTEDSGRFRLFLKKFPLLTDDDIKYLASKNFRGFGRLSAKFLTEPVQPDNKAGDKRSIINMMWDGNYNLQQLMSERFDFRKMVEKARKEYYSTVQDSTLLSRLDSMYVSNAVKRPIIRTMTVLDEVVRTMGKAPRKIFVEMARDVDGVNKKEPKISRLAELKKLYLQIADEDVRELSKELEKYDDAALQKDVLYLYFMQLGKDMYTGDAININNLSAYDKEHIYPQSKVKDDSLLNNIVLVRKDINGQKSDSYPLNNDIRSGRTPFWQYLLEHDLISKEKYFRLTRSTPFSDDEKWGFINRQLVETRQSTKVITELLKERYPESQIVYVKAGLVSEFRKQTDLVKSRTLNDLHHGKDAYLNVVVGNVWHELFTRSWFSSNSDKYNIKTSAIFGIEKDKEKKVCIRRDSAENVYWDNELFLPLVSANMARNYMHMTSYAYCQHGGLFDQNPVAAAAGLIPLKKGKATELYGGYNKSAASFFIFALTEEVVKNKLKKELTLVPVDLMIADKFLSNQTFAVDYVKQLKKDQNKNVSSVKFPFGMKKIKIKTVFEIDNGLRFCLNGKSSGGKQLLISLFTPLLLDSNWEKYIKRLETFVEKKKKNLSLTYSEKFDGFTVDDNIKLFDALLDKMNKGVFSMRPANLHDSLVKVRDKFVLLPPEEQAAVLLSIVDSFGTSSGVGVDLGKFDGVSKAGVTLLSSNFANWKKTLKTAHIVYSNASGLHETKSINLLDLI